MSTKLNISLPPSMQKWVRQHVASQGYRSTDAFFREMVLREQALVSRERIDHLLTEAMSEGEPTPMTRKDWERIRVAGMKLARGRRRK